MARDIDQLPSAGNFPSFSGEPADVRAAEGSSIPDAGLEKRLHPKPSEATQGYGYNLLQNIDQFDDLAQQRNDSDNMYYPFASRAEWQLARWLSTTSLPQSEVNNFLHLDWVSSI